MEVKENEVMEHLRYFENSAAYWQHRSALTYCAAMKVRDDNSPKTAAAHQKEAAALSRAARTYLAQAILEAKRKN